MNRLKRTVGNYVTGDRFWNRQREIESFIALLDEGAHILMAAPRRIGKTSLMREAANRLSDRYYCLQVDLQKATSPADAVTELSSATHPFSSLWSKTTAVFKNILSGVRENIESLGIEDLTVTLRSGMTAGDWKAKGDQLFTTLAEADRPVIVFFDEFPILVNRLLKGNSFEMTPGRRAMTDEFMSWVRDNSTRHKETIRMVITGSIGIEPALRQAGLSATLNTFTPFELPAWDRDTAQECLAALANEYGLIIDPPAMERMVDRLGYLIPHHVQLFFDAIYTECHHKGIKHVDPTLVDKVYNKKMLSIQGHAELSHMEERLKVALGAEKFPIALDLLTEAAVVGHLDSDAARFLCQEYPVDEKELGSLLRELLEIFQHDGYLENHADQYVFASNLLRDWWKARFSFGYETVSQRRQNR